MVATILSATQAATVHTMQQLLPGGPEVCIDAAGFRYAHGALHGAMRSVGLETDTPETLNECIAVCRKGGRVSIIADYYGFAHGLNIGGVMEKGPTLKGAGQCFVQKYWQQLLRWLEEGRITVPWMFTHTFPMEEAQRAYEMFDKKEEACMKILLKPKDEQVPGHGGA